MKKVPEKATLAVMLLAAGFMGLSFFRQGGSTCNLVALPSVRPVALERIDGWELERADGRIVSAAESEGNVKIVNFWATWCPSCRTQNPDLIALQNDLGDRGGQVLSVSLDRGPRAAVETYAASAGLNFPVLYGNAEQLAAFGPIRAVPTTFVLAPDGTVLERIEGRVDRARLMALAAPYLTAR